MDELPLPWPEFRELWRPVQGHSHYEVSSLGRLRSYRTIGGARGGVRIGLVPRLLSLNNRSTHGYVRAGLMRDGKSHTVFAHRAVLEAFAGPYREGLVCRHLDGDQLNNSVNNLAWGTQKENNADTIRHGARRANPRLGESHPHAVLTNDLVRLIRRRVACGEKVRPLARELGFSRNCVQRAVAGETWRHVT